MHFIKVNLKTYIKVQCKLKTFPTKFALNFEIIRTKHMV